MTVIYRDKSYGPHGWHSGHIIPDKDGGPNFLENHRPICIECNTNDKKYKSNYHYMASIGTMTMEEAERSYIELFERLEYIRRNIDCNRCIGYYNNGNKCTYRKKPHSLFCGRCGRNPKIQFDRYSRWLTKEVMAIHKSALKAAYIYGDDEDVELITSMINDLINLGKC